MCEDVRIDDGRFSFKGSRNETRAMKHWRYTRHEKLKTRLQEEFSFGL